MKLRLALVVSLMTSPAMAQDCKSMLDKIDNFIARAKFSQQAYARIKAARDRAQRLHGMGRNAECIEEARNLSRLLGLDDAGAGKRR